MLYTRNKGIIIIIKSAHGLSVAKTSEIIPNNSCMVIKVRASHTFWQDHNVYLLCSSDVKKAVLS